MATKRSISQARYDEKSTWRIGLKFNVKTDADIREHLERQESMQGYIKSLIRADIAAHGGAPIKEGN